MKLGTNDIGPLILRVGSGGLMATLFGYEDLAHFSENASTFPAVLGLSPHTSLLLATFSQLFCAVAVVLGLLTRLALLPLLATMTVALIVVHDGQPLAEKEHALLYLCAYSALLFTGPGRLSLDRLIFKRPQ